MEKSIEDKITDRLKIVSDALEVEVTLVGDPKDENRVQPHFDINDIVGKLLGLSVYCGWSVPINFAPSYNAVHANVEFWKKLFAAQPQEPQTPQQEMQQEN